MVTPVVATELPSGPVLPEGLSPDWRFERDLGCPTCQYNLRMAREPRCPECGTIFRWQAVLRISCPRCARSLDQTDERVCPECALDLNWDKLLGDADPEKLRHFEYSRSPLRCLPSILVGVSRPKRFWAEIPIELPPVVSRLRRLEVALALFALISVGVFALVADSYRTIADLFVLVCAPWLTLKILPWFVPTLNRYRVRPEQMRRVTAYTATTHFRSGIVMLFVVALVVTAQFWWPIGPAASPLWLNPGWLLGLLFWGGPGIDRALVSFNVIFGGLLVWFGFVWPTHFLAISLRRYLRIDRSNVFALLFCTQMIVLMAGLVVSAYLGSIEPLFTAAFYFWQSP